ncbi:MAG: tRNA preQ1(34) S-adenosylmethionine ribosyltransferase-isomerase QueA [Candidatus Poribacteria bacterium]|nr:tRNA preQ1(34) S-adenosylmethionine ribosyltransferase-isomerase QueA [Candidatus Poribacteria bacterium]
MKLSDFDYHLPDELIAQRPAERRDGSRLMVIHRETGEIEHRRFPDITEYLRRGDVLVRNNTRVIPARLFGVKVKTGGRVELLLIRPLGGGVWETLARPGRRLSAGTRLTLGEGLLHAEVVGRDGETFRVRFEEVADFDARLDRAGKIPLPPYINREADAADCERYQCVYADVNGAVAAPTAGLHFTPELFDNLKTRGIDAVDVTLHVGLGTFQPVQNENLDETRLHGEWASLSEDAARRLRGVKASGGRIVAVGTTSVRTLETAARGGTIQPYEGTTDLFLKPGDMFHATNALVTNFHLPKSSLLMLVAAFAGYDLMRRAYDTAVAERYRFYSYGDAMLIV